MWTTLMLRNYQGRCCQELCLARVTWANPKGGLFCFKVLMKEGSEPSNTEQLVELRCCLLPLTPWESTEFCSFGAR